MSADPGRLRSTLFLVAAGLLAALTGLFTHRMLAAHKAQLARQATPAKTVQVVQAVHDLAPGSAVDPSSLQLVEVREGLLQPGSYVGSLEELAGASPTSPVLAGELIHPQRFAVQPELYGVESALTPGMRAISLALDADAAVGGLVRPGRYVDAVVTVQAETEGVPTDWFTETVIQSARVLAVADASGSTWTVSSQTGAATDAGGPAGGAGAAAGAAGAAPAAGRTGPSATGKVVVTLELSPDESERLALAARRGDVRLALRRADDLAPLTHDSPLVARALVGLQAAPAAEAEQRVSKVRARIRQQVEQPAEAGTEPFSAEVVEGPRREVQQLGVGDEGTSGRARKAGARQ